MPRPSIAIHGGAGTITRASMTEDLEKQYREGLEIALRTGWHILESGGAALDAAEAAVMSLENCPLFNAGRGSVFTHEGKIEMDAAIMNGTTREAGAVAAVRNVKNPIKLARAVMERSGHVLLSSDGADEFAEEQKIELRDNTYFFTEFRWKQLEDAIAAGSVQLDHSAPKPMGTVGAVACDMQGQLAAATSTGGMTNKRFGRIGDTPIVGSGTFADDLCAVSCTGHGEFFMRSVTAYDVAARIRYGGQSLHDASAAAIAELGKLGGEGGLIAVNREGNTVLPFNSAGMYRGWVADGQPHIEIYK